MSDEQIKQIIKTELPAILRRDKGMRKWVIDLSKMHFADKKTTESRFDATLEEMRRERERQDEKWEKQDEKWKEQDKKWWKNQAEIRIMVASIDRLSRKHDSTIGALGARWGLRTEESFRNALKAILEEYFQVEVLRIVEYDDTGEVFGRPDQIEIDLIVKDGLLIIAEIKSSMSKPDMHTFYKKVIFYTKRHQREVSKMIVISPMVDDRAKAVAKELGIAIYSHAEEARL